MTAVRILGRVASAVVRTLIERKLNGESVTQEDRKEAVAEARAERELEGVDMDAELRSLLDEVRS